MSELKSPAFEGHDSVAWEEPRPIRPTGILHFTIGVTDLEKARKFYEEVLGCSYWRQNDTTVFMQVGEQYFVLSRTGYHQPPNRPRDTLIHNAFIVDGADFDSAMSWLEANGVEIDLYDDEGHSSFSGRHAYFLDPDGNGVEIIDLQRVGPPPPGTETPKSSRPPKSHLPSITG